LARFHLTIIAQSWSFALRFMRIHSDLVPGPSYARQLVEINWQGASLRARHWPATKNYHFPSGACGNGPPIYETNEMSSGAPRCPCISG
jgi:hypothetical protein